ncbi:hypothetical protein [Simkania sp.]|uniref:hypothetical protein n=1 Tax=Simkania sp. TaxID=34094 RepID=UPI003B52E5F4
MKTQAAQIFIYAVAAFGSTYFLPNVASSAGYVMTKENAMACTFASSLANFICMMLKTP